MFTLLVVVCITATLGFFSQELNRFLKKVFAIKGVPLVLPLTLATCFVVEWQELALQLLDYIKERLNKFDQLLLYIFPKWRYSDDIVMICLLTAVSVVPILLLNVHYYRKTHRPYPYPYLLSTLIWIISAVLLVSIPALYQ